MPMFQGAGMLQLQPAFQYLILMIRRACDLDLVYDIFAGFEIGIKVYIIQKLH